MNLKQAKNNNIGNEDYINPKCWLVTSLGYRPIQRCKYCNIRYRDCFLVHFFILSVFLFAIIFFSLFIFDFEIKKFFGIVFLIIFISYGYLSNKETDKLINQRFKILEISNELKKANKSLKRLDEVKSEFISVAAHQLRTPLTEIKWALGSFINGEFGHVKEAQKNILESAYRSNERIVKIINNLLEIKKTESDKLGYNFEKSHIEEVAEEALKNFSFMAKEKKIDIRLVKPEKRLPYIIMDSMKIGIALNILIENAIKYTPDRGMIEIKLENIGYYAKVSVKDNGIGIKKEDTERIFTYFFRGKEAIGMYTDGSGLGLYIAKNIIEMHGGGIGFESSGEKGKGSVFHFTIPFPEVREE